MRVTGGARGHWTERSGKARRPVDPESEDLLAADRPVEVNRHGVSRKGPRTAGDLDDPFPSISDIHPGRGAAVTAVVHVGMSIAEANERDALRRRAAADGATVAYLQHGEPSLVAELTRLADAGETSIRLEPVVLHGRSPARSWLRRVAGHWARETADRPTVVVAGGGSGSGSGNEVTGAEAGLTSPAWEDVPGHARHVLVCRGPRCAARGAEETADTISRTLGELGLGDDDVLVTQTGCLFPCNQAPVVVVHPDDAWFGKVDAHAARRILMEHVVWGLPVHPHRLPRKKHQI